MKYCDHCNKTSDDYSDTQGFRRHIKSHEGNKTCEICSKLLKNSNVLKQHTKSVYEDMTTQRCKI